MSDPGTYPGSGQTHYEASDETAFLQNLLFAQVADMVRPISLFSWDAVKGWNKQISLLWIDGNHEYEAVRRDFQDWSQFVTAEGVIALHDAAHPEAGPTRVAVEACASGKWKLTEQAEKVAVLCRV